MHDGMETGDGLPFAAGTRLRLRSDPGRSGIFTGRVRNAGGYLLLELEYGPNDRSFNRATQVEPVDEAMDMYDLFRAGRFGGPADLRRIIVTTKLAGDLTNVFYSMHAGNTEFLAHQFKPVLRFNESTRGRLLIADEVGLGKTIEAIYVWKELQAREGASRLLVVCPSMLREKWKRDLELRFSIEADILDARELVERVQSTLRMPTRKSFAAVVSIEGIRARDTDWDPLARSARAMLCGILEECAERDGEEVFDLVVIDEAHYLRNSVTASHKTAALLRDNARNLVLLSATPIQTAEVNLYNLLKLLAPEEFDDLESFQTLSKANVALIELENLLRGGGSESACLDKLGEATSNRSFIEDAFFAKLEDRLKGDPLTPEARLDLARGVGDRTFLSQYVSRTRKRDVVENRVIRVAETVDFEFTPAEKSVYDAVTRFIRSKSPNGTLMTQFALIARQRQMTSCLPAALRHWRDNASMDEQLWDDLGLERADSDDGEIPLYAAESDDPYDGSPPVDVEFGQIEAGDSKYRSLERKLRSLLDRMAGEKVIIFTFYRHTVRYLEERLGSDGFRVTSILGGMGSEKYERIAEFAELDGPSILLSTEVGAEGIDLQFARVVVNYDLPWNPMKLEQRIGRIDRIGQESDRIFIYNLTCRDTIEDQVLLRLYDRIDIFRRSIGDLEDILGDTVQELALDLIDPNLTDAERVERADLNQKAIIEKRRLRDELEDKAIELVGFSDYIARAISDARDLDRFIGPEDTMALVDDFFAGKYPGTSIRAAGEGSALSIRLSSDAKASLALSMERSRSPGASILPRTDGEVLGVFNPKYRPKRASSPIELVDPVHPLIRWILEENGRDGAGGYPCAAIALEGGAARPDGVYVYCVQLWSASGWKSRKELKFFAVDLDGLELERQVAERLVVDAFRDGKPWKTVGTDLDLVKAHAALTKIVDRASGVYSKFENEFREDNRVICDKQERYARLTAERKLGELDELLKRLELENKTRVIPMHRSRRPKIEAQLSMQLGRIAEYRKDVVNLKDVAVGIMGVGK